MLWAVLLIGHLIGIVGYTLLIRKSTTLGKLDKLLMSTLMMTGVFLPSLILLMLGKVSFDHTPYQWAFLFLGGFMVAGLMITNVWALSHLDASMFTILYNLRLMVTTLLGYLFLHELPKTLQLVGGSVIFLSILLLNLHKNSRWRSRPILIGIIAMLWSSFHATIEKHNINQVGFESYVFIFGLIGTVILWSLVLYKRINVINQIEHIRDKNIYWLLVLRALAAWAYVYALRYGSVAVNGYVSGMSVALIVLFGIFVLNEREQTKQKLAAVGVACMGLSLILISKLAGV